MTSRVLSIEGAALSPAWAVMEHLPAPVALQSQCLLRNLCIDVSNSHHSADAN